MYVWNLLFFTKYLVQVGELAENTCPHCGDIMLAATTSPVFWIVSSKLFKKCIRDAGSTADIAEAWSLFLPVLSALFCFFLLLLSVFIYFYLILSVYISFYLILSRFIRFYLFISITSDFICFYPFYLFLNIFICLICRRLP